MTIMPVNNLLTREELDALPDDGLRHELIDGVFVMTPAPEVGHQRMSAALYRTLWAANRDGHLEVLVAPVDVAIGASVVEPDLVVAQSDDFTEAGLATAPLLTVEIRSPSTVWIDEGRKRTLYEEHGVASYWLLDPTAPSIAVLELVDGRYVEAATAHGDRTIEVTAPFPVTLNPAVLARGCGATDPTVRPDLGLCAMIIACSRHLWCREHAMIMVERLGPLADVHGRWDGPAIAGMRLSL